MLVLGIFICVLHRHASVVERRQFAVFEKAAQVGLRQIGHRLTRFMGAAGEMRQQHDIVMAHQCREQLGFTLEPIQLRAGDALVHQRIDQGRLIDRGAARC